MKTCQLAIVCIKTLVCMGLIEMASEREPGPPAIGQEYEILPFVTLQRIFSLFAVQPDKLAMTRGETELYGAR